MSNGYHDQWEPPRGGWGCLTVLIIGGWALLIWLGLWLKRFFGW